MGAWFPSNTVWPGPRSTSVPSGILIHPAVRPQQTWVENWGLCPLGMGGSPSNTVWPGPMPTSKWHLDPSSRLATIRAPKIGGYTLFGGAGSNTMSPEPRPTSVPSGILIHRAVLPQQIWAENWALRSFWVELGPHLTQCGRDRGLPPCQVSS